MSWWKLAFRLNKTKQELQGLLTSSEFVEALEVMELEWHEKTKLDHYLAQIVAAIICSVSKNPESIRITDYLLPFNTETEADRNRLPTEEELEEKMEISKAAWGAFGEMNKELPPVPPELENMQLQRSRR